ncbi:MAG TPA: hypothetical protein VNW90_25215 [Acetobacteraceae bacterium]|nr:hypothetical protein [Acetobacteraceae bacterium]
MTFPPMRPQLEIQLKHDMLMCLMGDSRLLQAIVPRQYHAALAMATDALCWVLHHDVESHPHSHAGDFAQCLKDIQEGLESIGGPFEPPPDTEYVVEE